MKMPRCKRAHSPDYNPSTSSLHSIRGLPATSLAATRSRRSWTRWGPPHLRSQSCVACPSCPRPGAETPPAPGTTPSLSPISSTESAELDSSSTPPPPGVSPSPPPTSSPLESSGSPPAPSRSPSPALLLRLPSPSPSPTSPPLSPLLVDLDPDSSEEEYFENPGGEYFEYQSLSASQENIELIDLTSPDREDPFLPHLPSPVPVAEREPDRWDRDTPPPLLPPSSSSSSSGPGTPDFWRDLNQRTDRISQGFEEVRATIRASIRSADRISRIIDQLNATLSAPIDSPEREEGQCSSSSSAPSSPESLQVDKKVSKK